MGCFKSPSGRLTLIFFRRLSELWLKLENAVVPSRPEHKRIHAIGLIVSRHRDSSGRQSKGANISHSIIWKLWPELAYHSGAACARAAVRYHLFCIDPFKSLVYSFVESKNEKIHKVQLFVWPLARHWDPSRRVANPASGRARATSDLSKAHTQAWLPPRAGPATSQLSARGWEVSRTFYANFRMRMSVDLPAPGAVP